MRHLYLMVCLTLLSPAFSSLAQESPGGIKDGFFARYDYAAQRLTALADALPADKFDARPGEGAMSIELVFMHLIHYNYLYPEMLGIQPPAGIDMDQLEKMTGKASVLMYLEDSLEHVRKSLNHMSAEDLHKIVELYGNDTQAFNVFIQLQVHMGEHLGQLMAYARMVGVVPPWSQ